MSDGPPIKLTDAENQVGTIEEEKQRALIRSLDADTKTRLWVAGVMTVLFVGLNAAVIFLVWHAFAADVDLLKSKLIQNNQRLIHEAESARLKKKGKAQRRNRD